MSTYFIITTVGTSVFSNFNKQKVKLAFNKSREGQAVYGDGVDIKNLEGCTAQDYIEQRVTLTSIEEKIEDFWLKDIEKTDHGWDWNGLNNEVPNRHASAEITSILEIAEKIKKEDQDAKIMVRLLATDTALSVSAAKLIGQFPFSQFKFGMEKPKFDPKNDFILSLGVHPSEEQNKKQYYDEGLQHLVERLIGKEGLIKKAKKDKIKSVINFSGGYKAIIPYLTIIAQLEDIPMYYIYEESDYLMEVGSLPVNFDWAAVEALKPLLKSYILDKLNILAPLLSKDLIEFKEGKYQQKDNDPEVISILAQLSGNGHGVIHGLLSYKLIRLKNEQEFEVTPLGKIVCKVNVAADKGFVMEHLLFRYFSLSKRIDYLEDYQTRLSSIDNNAFGFRVADAGRSKIEIIDDKPKGQDSSVREIGDIDISLERKVQTFVWAESKAYSTACDYHKTIGKNKDYYFQLKARAKSLEKQYDSIELLFIVFRFVFKDINDNNFLDSKYFKTVLERFEELNEDEDIKSFASFRCIGITIPIDFDKDRIDFTSFYKGDFNNWIFEELKTAEHA